jgi:streptogramin lyase
MFHWLRGSRRDPKPGRQRARRPAPCPQLVLEGLEDRFLMSNGIVEFRPPTANSLPDAITVGPDGNLWFTEYGANKIGRFNPTTNTFAEFTLPTSGAGPEGITAGPDGNLWFTESTASKIGRFNPAGTITEFALPTAGSGPTGITVGPPGDNGLWFTEYLGNKIGRITTGGAITETALPTPNSRPYGITARPEGYLWFTESWGNKIGRITTGGVITTNDEFPLPMPGSNPLYITSGPDGNLWFAEFGARQIGRFNPVSRTLVGEYPIPSGHGPWGITAGPSSDGGLWFAESDGNRIGRIIPNGSAASITGEFVVPTADSGPFGITADSACNIWFTELYAHQIGKLTCDRSLHSVATPPLTPTEGTASTGVVARFTDDDPSATARDFVATITWGTGLVTAGIVSGGPTFTVTGAYLYPEEGNYPVTVTITDINDTNDIGGSTLAIASTVSVADAALSAQAATFINPIGSENSAISNLTLAYFDDAGGPEPASNYSATIDWGAGATSTGVVGRTGSLLSVAGSYTYAEEGNYAVKVTIRDEGGSTVTVTTNVVVADPYPVVTAAPVYPVEGLPFNGIVATFTDPAGPEPVANYSATIDWGDGTTTPGVIGMVDAVTFSVSAPAGGHTYVEEGNYTINLTVQHELAGTCILPNFHITVADPDLQLTEVKPNIQATEGLPFTASLVNFTDPGGPETLGSYQAVINWGDSPTTFAGTIVVVGPNNFAVVEDHTYAEEGVYPITVTLLHENQPPIVVNSLATVGDAPLWAIGVPLCGCSGVPLTNTLVAVLGDQGGPDPADYTGTINWGDGVTSPAAFAQTGILFSVTGTHTYAAAGVYPVTVSITDTPPLGGGSTVTVATTATITNCGGSGGYGMGPRPRSDQPLAQPLSVGSIDALFGTLLSQTLLPNSVDTTGRLSGHELQDGTAYQAPLPQENQSSPAPTGTATRHQAAMVGSRRRGFAPALGRTFERGLPASRPEPGDMEMGFQWPHLGDLPALGDWTDWESR